MKITTKILEGYRSQKGVGSVEPLAFNDFTSAATGHSLSLYSAMMLFHTVLTVVCLLDITLSQSYDFQSDVDQDLKWGSWLCHYFNVFSYK